MYLVDTNVWLKLLLAQEKAAEAQAFFERVEAGQLAMTEFSLYSLGIILTRLNKDAVFTDFLSDVLEVAQVTCVRLETTDLKHMLFLRQKFQLDFDDAYQYAAAEKHDCVMVSFDKGFDRTERGRKTPAQIINALP